MDLEKHIWDYFKNRGFNDYGVAGLMGNLYAESALKSNNLQRTYEIKLEFTDETYTSAVDDGSYTNFINDSGGYGLAQWTYWTRKRSLLQYAKEQGTSIGDLDMQLEFLYNELVSDFPAVVSVLRSATSVLEASNTVLFKFERPANQGIEVQQLRCSYGQKYYDKFADIPNTDSNSVPSPWAEESVNWAIETGILKGDGKSYQLRREVNREECMVFLHRLYKLIKEEQK